MTVSADRIEELKERIAAKKNAISRKRLELNRKLYGDVPWGDLMGLDLIQPPLSPTFDLGFVRVDRDGVKLESFLDDTSNRRIAPELTSWIGVSIGATHWYARLRIVDWPDWRDPVTKVVPRIISMSNLPPPCEVHTFAVRRPLTAIDLEWSADRWSGYEVGEYAEAFETEEEAQDAIDAALPIWFPEWKVVEKEW